MPEASSDSTASPANADNVVEALVSNGFSVEQILRFYVEYEKRGMISDKTSTNEVVAKIVIPETADSRCCYMDSPFMQSIGGKKRAARLCSHAWKARFVNTVRSIIMDASLYSKEEWILLKFNPEHLLKELPQDVLSKTYWLCIFGINEHYAICGGCWGCNDTAAWQHDPRAHLRANPCLLCGKPKYNPCSCGSIKVCPDDPRYEIDKFDALVAKMDAHMVSLDEKLETLERVWVVAEIGEAFKSKALYFRVPSLLDDCVVDKLRHDLDLVPSVQECVASSPADKEMILQRIRNEDVGIHAYDECVNCIVELNFGRCSRLTRLPEAATAAMHKLKHLEMDFTWCRAELDSEIPLHKMLGEVRSFGILHLSHLSMNFRGCSNLSDLSTLVDCLNTQQNLLQLSLDLSETAVHDSSVKNLFSGLSHLAKLTTLKLKLNSCPQIMSTQILCYRAATALTSLTFDVGHCSHLAGGLETLGASIALLTWLRSFRLDVRQCSGLANGLAGLVQGFAPLVSLNTLALNFRSSSVTGELSELGRSLASLTSMTSLELDFGFCKGLTGTTDELSHGLLPLSSLKSLVLILSGCVHLKGDAMELGRGLSSLTALTSLKLGLAGCTSLQGVEAVLLGKLSPLPSMSDFYLLTPNRDDVRSLHDLEELVRQKLIRLHSLEQSDVSTFEQPNSSPQALAEWLKSLRLDRYLDAAVAWCRERRAMHLCDVQENWEDFAEDLKMKPLEKNRIQKASTSKSPEELQVHRSRLPHEAAATEVERFGPSEDPQKYTVLKYIGAGSQAMVRRCKCGAEERAVKTIDLRRLRLQRNPDRLLEKIQQEAAILVSLRHPRIVCLFESFMEHDCNGNAISFHLALELMDSSTIFDHICSTGPLREPPACHVFCQICEGLEFVHSKGFVHGDLKPENILLVPRASSHDRLEVKLSDFGVAKNILADGYTVALTRVGTPLYMAPEVSDPQMAKFGYDATADLWSLGILLYVILQGAYPFSGDDRTSFSCGPHVSRRAEDLIRSLIKMNPRDRLPIHRCLEHAWLSES